MKKILFITNRNVLTTCGAFRLIKNRAEILYDEYNIVTDFCVFQKQDRFRLTIREVIHSGGILKGIGYNLITLIPSYFKFLGLIKKMLSSYKYSAVILSETSLPVSISMLRRYLTAPIYIDGHGASEDIYESVRDGNKLAFVVRVFVCYVDKCLLRFYLKRINGAFVVSSGMKTYYEKLTSNKNLYFVTAPCATIAISEREKYDIYRKAYRTQFHVTDDELCFVYSGGIEPWQSVPKTISLFKDIANNLTRPCKMFIFTYETSKVEGMIGNDKRCVVKSFDTDALGKALCAMDYAFLLREDTITNHVAFPNKFLEYVKARLYVIATPYVYDVAEQIRDNHIGYIYMFDKNIDGLCNYIEYTKGSHISASISSEILVNNGFKNRLSNFVKGL